MPTVQSMKVKPKPLNYDTKMNKKMNFSRYYLLRNVKNGKTISNFQQIRIPAFSAPQLHCVPLPPFAVELKRSFSTAFRKQISDLRKSA